jgi:hypothetical protein
MRHWIEINRAPVLTLWAAMVAKRLGFDWEEALTLGRAVAGLNAYSKGRALGLFEPTPEAVAEKRAQVRREKGAVSINLLRREVPAVLTEGARIPLLLYFSDQEPHRCGSFGKASR